MTTFGQRVREARKEAKLTQPQLAKAAGLSQTTISDIERGRNSGSSEVTSLARALNVTPEWLAEGRLPKRIISIVGETEPLVPQFSAEITLLKKADDYCEIPQFDTGGAMGGGLVLQDQPGVIQSWKVSPEWLRKNVKGYNSAKSLCIVTGFGDSMRPLFNPGDPLLVDISVNTVDFDSIYFFRVGNEGFIKRLQRIPGEGLRVLSANRDNYEPWTVRPDMDFEVFGRVLKVWRSEDF